MTQKPTSPPPNVDRTQDGRPICHIHPSNIGWSLDDLEFALLDQGTEVYQQNGRVVHLIRHNAIAGAKPSPIVRAQGGLAIVEVTPHYLAELAMQAGPWVKRNMSKDTSVPDPDNPGKFKKGRWEKTPFPVEYARHFIARGQWNLRVLRGFVETPTLRRDGSLLDTPGYDEASQLVYDPGGTEYAALDEAPTKDDARNALALLIDPIKDFPFEPGEGEAWGEDTASRAVALSAILTGLVRASIDTAPAHVFDAPTMGTGKTKLAEIAGVVSTGHAPTSFSYGADQAEFQKRLFSILFQGDRAAIIDNIEQEVESDEFCSVLTSPEWQSRVLGVSKMAKVATNTLWLLNGNRVTFKGDITDRVVVCNLDARMEDPKTRTFDREPVAYALEHRTDLVRAGLTVLLAHALAGFPGAKGLTPSRFPDWDKMVRGALVWLGQPDPQLTRQRVVSVDPVREIHGALLREWEDAIGVDVPVTAKALITQSEVFDDAQVGDFRWGFYGTLWPVQTAEALQDALRSATNSARPNPKSVGRYLTKLVGRVHQGLVIRSRADNKSASQFWIEKVRKGGFGG